MLFTFLDAFLDVCLRILIFGAVKDTASQSWKKTIVFHSCFLENSENFLTFAKNSNEFGQFLQFPEFSRAF